MRAALLAAWILTAGLPAQAQNLPFSALAGWEAEDHIAAMKVFQKSCAPLDRPIWAPDLQIGRNRWAKPCIGPRVF